MGPSKSHARSKSGQAKSSTPKPTTDNLNVKVTTRKRSASGAPVQSKPAEIVDDTEDAIINPLVWKCDEMNRKPRQVLSKPNLPTILHGQRLGLTKSSQYHQSVVPPIMTYTSQFRVAKLATPFDRRVTALAWHPRYTRVCTAGSKSGDLVLWDTSKKVEGDMFKDMIKGRGPGGSVQSLVLDEINPDRFYTACIDGTVATQLYSDKEGSRKKVFLQTNDWERWYTGLDISFTSNLLVAGNSRGLVSLLSLEGEKVWDLKLHKTKCNFVQFSTRQPWMMVTSSVDHMVKIWDIRKISSKNSALAVLPHDKAVNSAYFSLVSGDKLLTTDQHSQLRVYQAPTFSTYTTIHHPHRQFQHLSPIKATWHPLADIVVVGRYPDPKFASYSEGELRSIDFFSGLTGESLHQLHQHGLDNIMSLSQFNPSGDLMISSLSGSLLLWKAKSDTIDDEDTDGSTSKQGLADEEWPDFKTKKGKSAQKKKLIGEKK